MASLARPQAYEIKVVVSVVPTAALFIFNILYILIQWTHRGFRILYNCPMKVQEVVQPGTTGSRSFSDGTCPLEALQLAGPVSFFLNIMLP